MAILIDGYNLLNATGVEGTGRGTELKRARRGLLGLLANKLTESERATTTIVFDAHDAPPGLPKQESFRGMTLLFARDYAEADDLLEELIQADHSPRKLTVVSSDHRLHRAARRRKAMPIDSENWIAQIAGRSDQALSDGAPSKPVVSAETTESWLAEFADVDVAAIEQELTNDSDNEDIRPAATATDPSRKKKNAKRPPAAKEGADASALDALKNPFPADFGSELEELPTDHGDHGDGLDPFPPNFGEELEDEDFSS
jgi:hypothetical protein